MENLCATFQLFRVAHFAYIFMAIGIAVGLIFAFRKKSDDFCKWVGIVLVSLAGLFAVLDFVGKIFVVDNVFEHLPINPYHIFAYLCIFVEITKNASWTKFAYLIIVPVSALSLFFVPNIYKSMGMVSISVISYFLLNAILVAYSVLKILWTDEYLSKKDILSITMDFTIIVAIAHIINVFFRFTVIGTEANYFGTMGEEYDILIGLLSRLIPIPFVNIIPLIAVIVGIEFLLFLPFDIMKTKQDNREQLEEIVALGNLKAQARFRKNNKSQVLVRGENKARPEVQKTARSSAHKDGFVSINKEITVNKDDHK